MSAGRWIVVVEDEGDIARLVAFHLQRHGYQTVVAADGRTALNLVLEYKPDLVILDLMLPQLHGHEVCRLLKSAPSTRQIPILMLTALASTEDKLTGFKFGADDYMTKPFEPRELVARAMVLLRRADSPCGSYVTNPTPSRLDR